MKSTLPFLLGLLFLQGQAQLPRVSSGTIKRLDSFPSKFVLPRNVDIWLPEGYGESRKYSVLYMHDGQMLFDSTYNWNHQEWGVDETLGKLEKENRISDCIVVGIWNIPKFRFPEYFPQKALSYLGNAESREINSLLTGGPKADAYLQFIVKELKPYIDGHFPTYSDPDHTFIAGSSMGGLISLYALCEYPEVFGGAACLSTHWPGLFRADNNPVPGAILQYLQEHLPVPGRHRIYFDHGDRTLDSLYALPQQRVDSLMKAKGFSGSQWQSLVFPGEDHTERAWKKRLYIPMLFLLKK
jgi:enterochelin esterase-like enzyme